MDLQHRFIRSEKCVVDPLINHIFITYLYNYYLFSPAQGQRKSLAALP